MTPGTKLRSNSQKLKYFECTCFVCNFKRFRGQGTGCKDFFSNPVPGTWHPVPKIIIMPKLADIHCHPGLHPFAWDYAGKKKKENVWDYNPPKPRERNSKYPGFTQSDFRTLAKGGVKLIYISIYPIEQGWLKPNVISDSGVTDILARFVSKLPAEFVNAVQSNDFKYFDFFTKEYDYLHKEDGKAHDVDGQIYRYMIQKPSDDLNDLLARENTIGAIMSVEGAQSFITGNADEINSGTYDFEQTIRNIEAVKTWDHPPFFVSMSHHFYNGFCGHARSLPGFASKLLDQSIGLNEPFNNNGRKVIDCFLALNDYAGNGQRILIDTKHMSVSARKEYYQKIRALNLGKPEAEKIPIVVSHTAYSGHATMDDAILRPDTDDDKYKDSGTFNNWSINLCDDEILEIFYSNGIMGLNFDERILSGQKVMDEYDAFSKRDIRNRTEGVRKFWALQMLNNLLGIVKAVVYSPDIQDPEKVKIWDMLAIGTDFDGMINPEDGFITSEEFADLKTLMAELMPLQADIGHLLQGLSVEEVLEKIFFANAVNFAQMYYFSS